MGAALEGSRLSATRGSRHSHARRLVADREGERGRTTTRNLDIVGARARVRHVPLVGLGLCPVCTAASVKDLSNDSMDSQDLTLLNFKQGEHSLTHKQQESCDIMRPTLKEFLRPYEPSTGAKLRVR